MKDELSGIFLSENIECFAPLPIEKCKVRRPDILLRAGLPAEQAKTAIMFLIPYYMGDGEGNISLYARPMDYHAYCDELFPRLCGKLCEKFGGRFVGFSDKSPIEEADAACRAGLGVVGDSYVIINEKYGSFVFLAEVFTDNPPEDFGCDPRGDFPLSYCPHCGACRRACPMTESGMDCLSAVTQKKGGLSENEKAYIKKYGSAWGCDICQLVCPLVKKAIDGGAETPIEFFRENRIKNLTPEALSEMTDEEFKKRAFSWRGRTTVERNLRLLFEED